MDVIYIHSKDLVGTPYKETKEGILEWHPVEDLYNLTYG